MLVKLTKIQELENAVVPGNVEVGHEKLGEFVKHPVVGEMFWVGLGYRTSTVTEILSIDTFKTKNSVYRFELLEKVDPIELEERVSS